MDAQKNIALVAHDNRKKDLIECVIFFWDPMEQEYIPIVKDYREYLRRDLL